MSTTDELNQVKKAIEKKINTLIAVNQVNLTSLLIHSAQKTPTDEEEDQIAELEREIATLEETRKAIVDPKKLIAFCEVLRQTASLIEMAREETPN